MTSIDIFLYVLDELTLNQKIIFFQIYDITGAEN